jgi:RecA/RadA recombinase
METKLDKGEIAMGKKDVLEFDKKDAAPMILSLINKGVSPLQTISHRTGFPLLDYHLGYKAAIDQGDGTIKLQNILGMLTGAFNLIVGPPSSGKTTFAIGIASNMVRPYEKGSVIHIDGEYSTVDSRIPAVSKFTLDEISSGKYWLTKDEFNSYQGIYKLVQDLHKEKTSNPKVFKTTSNIAGLKVDHYQPTVIIIDSIPTIKNESKEVINLDNRTGAMTDARILKALINGITGMLHEANINILAINHVQQKIEMNMFTHTSSEIPYLKQDEHIPGGTFLKYLTNTFLKLTPASEKFKLEEDGFDGFGINLSIIKARTNQSGKVILCIFDKINGLDILRTNVRYLKDRNKIGGNRKNSLFFMDDSKETRFNILNIYKSFDENPVLYEIMYKQLLPILEEEALSNPEMQNHEFNSKIYEY